MYANGKPESAAGLKNSGQAARRESRGWAGLAARDWILLPLCGIATIATLGGAVLGLARIEVPKEEATDGPCMIMLDPHLPVRGRPNTVCRPVLRELGRTEYRFNGCGHRTDLPCAPAPAGTFRIVAIGSSMVEGAGVAVEDTFVARLPADLTSATGGNYDAYSTGMLWGSPRSVWLRIDEVFRLKPALVLWPLTVWDLDHVNMRTPEVDGKPADERRPEEQAADASAARSGSSADGKAGSRLTKVFGDVEDSRSIYFLRHLLYKSQSQYESHFGLAGEGESGSEMAGFIESDPPQSWREHLDDFEFYFRQVASKLNARGIPLVVVLLPHRIQTDMVSTGRWSAHEDPYALGRAVQPIVEKYGAVWIDILHDFRQVPDTDRLFFPINGHMTAEGHKVLAAMISQELAGKELLQSSLSARRTP